MWSQLKDFSGRWYIATLPVVKAPGESDNFTNFNYDGPKCAAGPWAETYTLTCDAKDNDGTTYEATPEGVTKK